MQVISELKWMIFKEVSHEQAVLWGLPASSWQGGCATTCASHQEMAHNKDESLIVCLKVLIVTFLSRLQSFLPHGSPRQLKASENSDSSILGGLQIPSSVPKESLGEAGSSQSHTSGD